MARKDTAGARPGDEAGDRALVYVCECGKKWSAPPKGSSGRDANRWKCSCGRELAIREHVIFQV